MSTYVDVNLYARDIYNNNNWTKIKTSVNGEEIDFLNGYSYLYEAVRDCDDFLKPICSSFDDVPVDELASSNWIAKLSDLKDYELYRLGYILGKYYKKEVDMDDAYLLELEETDDMEFANRLYLRPEEYGQLRDAKKELYVPTLFYYGNCPEQYYISRMKQKANDLICSIPCGSEPGKSLDLSTVILVANVYH